HTTTRGPTLTPKLNKEAPHDQIAVDTNADHGNQQKASKGAERIECPAPIQNQIGKMNQNVSGQGKESSRSSPPNVRWIGANQRSGCQRCDQSDSEDDVQRIPRDAMLQMYLCEKAGSSSITSHAIKNAASANGGCDSQSKRGPKHRQNKPHRTAAPTS